MMNPYRYSAPPLVYLPPARALSPGYPVQGYGRYPVTSSPFTTSPPGRPLSMSSPASPFDIYGGGSDFARDMAGSSIKAHHAQHPFRKKMVNLVEKEFDRDLRKFTHLEPENAGRRSSPSGYPGYINNPYARDVYGVPGRYLQNDSDYRPSDRHARHHGGGGPLGSMVRVISSAVKGGLTGAVLGAGVTTPLLLIKAVRSRFKPAWGVAATVSGALGALAGGALGATGQFVREMIGAGSRRDPF